MGSLAKDRTQRSPTGPGGHPGRYVRIVLDHRWLVAAVFTAGIALFAVWATRTPRIYQATAKILVDASASQALGGEAHDVMTGGPGQFFAMQDYIQTQRKILISDSLARRALEKMHLADDKDFWIDGLPVDQSDAVERFLGALSVEPVPQTEILSVSFRHRDPKQAKRAVDGLVDTYIESNLNLHETLNVDASRWLAEQGDALRERLSKSENDLYDFKQKNEVLSVSLEDRINNVTQQIDRLSAGLTDARLRKAARLSEAEELQKMLTADPYGVAPVGAPGSLLEQKKRVNEEEQRLSELQARYESGHPLVRQQTSKVETARAALLRETKLVVRGAQARSSEVAGEEQKIAAQLATVKQEGMRVSRLEIDYNRLKRDTELLSKQYQLVATRMKETELASQSKVNNLRVLDYARTPRTAVTPNLARDTPIAVLVSLVAAIALAFLINSLDRRVKTQEDVEGRVGLPVLAGIPQLSGKGDLAVADDPRSTAAELYRLIRTNLLFADANSSLRRVLVTSAVPRDGKTFTALNLAAVMAQSEGKRVLVIDCDLRHPRVASVLGIEKRAGLTDVVLGATSLDDAIAPTRFPNLSALCAGPIPPSPSELLGGRRFQEILDACSERFDWVFIDSPPAGLVTDPAILAKSCDGAILVVRSGQTTFAQVARAQRALKDVAANVLGVVLNGARHSPDDYGYYGRPAEKARPRTAALRAA